MIIMVEWYAKLKELFGSLSTGDHLNLEIHFFSYAYSIAIAVAPNNTADSLPFQNACPIMFQSKYSSGAPPAR